MSAVWTADRERKLADLYCDGVNLETIARAVSAPSERSVKRKACRLGLRRPAPNTNYWTEGELDRLRELWASGLSCRLIGQRIGRTKSSVISKANKLGLDPRQSPVPGKESLPAAPVARLLLGVRPATMTTASGITLPRISMLEDAE